MKIILSGGGTLGPVAPLIAIYEKYKKHNSHCEFLWVGTKKGPERKIVEGYNISFYTISGGKLRRYISLFNIIDTIKILIGFFQSFIFLFKQKPDFLISAGGFVSVPLHWAAFILGIPTWIHQQDVQPGLANKLMARIATRITTTLRESTKYFSAKKTSWIGNPVRDLSVDDINISMKKFNLNKDKPVIFAFGGGTGSDSINKLIVEMLPHIPTDYQVIHLTGQERAGEYARGAINTHPNYQIHKFFASEMKDAYAVADLVIGRGGFVTITELASLKKPAILLPMPNTHQEANVKMLADNKAAIILDQRKVNGLDLGHIIKDLLDNPKVMSYLGERLYKILPPARDEKIFEIISNLEGHYSSDTNKD